MSKKTIYLFLLSFISIFSFFIYPEHSYSGGIDASLYQVMANTISHYGHIEWFRHPLAIWGFYPHSDQSGLPIFLASFKILSHTHLVRNIVILDYILGVFSILTIFCLFFKIKKNKIFAIYATFGFALCPTIINFLLFMLDSRGLLVILSPLWLLLFVYLVKSKGGKRKIFLSIFIILNFVFSLIHFIFLFLFMFILAYFISAIYLRGRDFVRLKLIKNQGLYDKIPFSKRLNNRYTRLFIWTSIMTVFFISLLSIGKYLPEYRFGLWRYRRFGYFESDETIYLLANVITRFGSEPGFSVIFAFLGYIVVATKKIKNVFQLTFLISILASFPFLLAGIYFVYFTFIFSIYFMAEFFVYLENKDINYKKIISIILVVLLVLGSITYTQTQRGNEAGDIPKQRFIHISFYTTEKTYSSGVYMRYNLKNNEKFSTYEKGPFSHRLEFISSKPRYGNPYSIETVYEISKKNFTISKQDYKILDPYYARDIYFPTVFSEDYKTFDEWCNKNNITTIHTISDLDRINDDKAVRNMNENNYKYYESDLSILWQV